MRWTGDWMKESKIVMIICAGFAVILAIFALSPFFGSAPVIDSWHHPFFVISNMDSNKTHTVDIEITNSTDRLMFKKNYVLAPRERTESEIHSGAASDDYIFTVRVDDSGKSQTRFTLGPTQVAILEVNPPGQADLISYSIIDLTSKASH